MSPRSNVREIYTQLYWVTSRQWRGDARFGDATMGSLIANLVNIAGAASRAHASGLEGAAARLLEQVINNKRCRKKKSPNNVVNFNERKAFRAEALLQELRRTRNLQDLVGLQIQVTIKHNKVG